MRLGIISDTHDRLERTARAVELLTSRGAEALIHCGDLTTPDIVFACAALPLYFVFGNNDDDWPALRRSAAAVNASCLESGGELELAGKHIAVTHGHLHQDVRRLLEKDPAYLLFGHSHAAADERVGRTRRINPGALFRAERYSVALLDSAEDDLEFIEVPR